MSIAFSIMERVRHKLLFAFSPSYRRVRARVEETRGWKRYAPIEMSPARGSGSRASSCPQWVESRRQQTLPERFAS